jgi:hypothetical protein
MANVVEGSLVIPEHLELYQNNPALFQSALKRGGDVATLIGDYDLSSIAPQHRRAWRAHFKSGALNPFADVEVVPQLQPHQTRTVQERALRYSVFVFGDLDFATRVERAEVQDLARPPSIAYASLAANLNEQQHNAFAYAAKALLFAKKKRLDELTRQPAPDAPLPSTRAQELLRMALQGVAGTQCLN